MNTKVSASIFLAMSLLVNSVHAENATLNIGETTRGYSDALKEAENTMTIYDNTISSIINESKETKTNGDAVKDKVNKIKVPGKKRNGKKSSKEIADFRKKSLAAEIAKKKKKNRHPKGTSPINKKRNAAKSYNAKKGVVISSKMYPIVDKIANHYKERTGRDLIINSGQRTPARQANAIYGRIVKLGKIGVYHLYKNKPAISNVLNAYQDHRGNKTKAIDSMTNVILKQVSKGTYLSRHMREGAIDVSKSSNRRALRNAVAHVNGSVANEGDHFHIQFNVNS